MMDIFSNDEGKNRCNRNMVLEKHTGNSMGGVSKQQCSLKENGNSYDQNHVEIQWKKGLKNLNRMGHTEAKRERGRGEPLT